MGSSGLVKGFGKRAILIDFVAFDSNQGLSVTTRNGESWGESTSDKSGRRKGKPTLRAPWRLVCKL